jgi:hypothetical protein
MIDWLVVAHKLVRVLAIVILILAFTQQVVLAAEPTPGGGVLDKMAVRIVKLILIFVGAAAAVIFTIVGVRILVSSAVQSSYGMAQGILALLAAGVGVLVALGGPGLAGLLIDAGKDATFETTIKYPF